MAALRTNDSYLQSLYRRKKSQLGHGRALGAVNHSMLCACWHMLTTGELYHDLGGDYLARRNPQHRRDGSSPSSNASATRSSSNPSQTQREPEVQLDPIVIFPLDDRTVPLL
jgi:hypothetical protein